MLKSAAVIVEDLDGNNGRVVDVYETIEQAQEAINRLGLPGKEYRIYYKEFPEEKTCKDCGQANCQMIGLDMPACTSWLVMENNI